MDIDNIKTLSIAGIPVAQLMIDGTPVWPKEPAPGYEGLCFTAQEASSSVKLQNVKGDYKTSTDGKSWTDYTLGDTISLPNVGDKVYFAARTENATCWNDDYDSKFVMTGRIAASGSIQSLLKADCSRTDAPTCCYLGMFYGCSSLTQAPALPATTLVAICYYGMFYGCTSLAQAPDLPATTLADWCYYCMFEDCTSLAQAPDLPATTLAAGCYLGMFEDCTSLAQAPDLPATTLADSCYYCMFSGCTSLTQAPELPATALASSCYYNMFSGCTSLKISEDTEGGTVVLSLPEGTETKSNWNTNMFSRTGGSFTGSPDVGKTYRCYN